jgi:hypothetical protein
VAWFPLPSQRPPVLRYAPAHRPPGSARRQGATEPGSPSDAPSAVVCGRLHRWQYPAAG